MKTFVSFLLGLIVAAALTGCWGEQGSSTSQPIPSPTPSHSQAQSHVPEEGSFTPRPEGVDSTLPESEPASEMRRAAAGAAAPQDDADWALTLVGPGHPLPADFNPPLRLIAGYDSRKFDIRAADALEALLAAAQKDNCPVYFASGYRSVKRQAGLYLRRMGRLLKTGMSRQQAQAALAPDICKGGESEHNLGLAADLVSGDWYSRHVGFQESFENTDAFRWLQQNAADFGFILRYPKNKQHITGIAYKPWHYRYVGTAAAAQMQAENLCFEEFLLKRGYTQ